MGDIAIQFSSLTEFLAMGKHGFYVWTAYGISALVVVLNVALPMLRRRNLLAQIRLNESRLRGAQNSTSS